LPIRIEFTSPRNTAPYQMLLSSPIITSPIITAVSAKKQLLPMLGLMPLSVFISAIFLLNLGMLLVQT
jgi:hypothetical protein